MAAAAAASDTMGRARPGKHTSVGDDIKAEVANYASSLGFGTNVLNADFDYADFAPEKASIRVGDDPAHPSDAPVPQKKSKNKFKNGSAQTDQAKLKSPSHPVTGAAVAERPWNDGVGRRPGVPPDLENRVMKTNNILVLRCILEHNSSASCCNSF